MLLVARHYLMTKFCILFALTDNGILKNMQTYGRLLVTPVKKTINKLAIISLIFQPNAHIQLNIRIVY